MQINPSLVVSKVAMLFLILLIGFYAGKKRFVDEKGTKTLSSLLVNITSPLLIITSFQMDFEAEKLKNALIILGASVVIHILMTFFGKLSFGWEKEAEKNKIMRFSIIFGNCAFLGYPVLDAIFGEGVGVFYGSFYCLMFNLYLWTYGIVMLQKGKENVEKPSLKKVFVNAGTIASLVGIVLFAAGIKLPGILWDAVDMVGDLTFPLSMIIIGTLISRLDFKKVLTNKRVYIFCAFKLLLQPLLMIAVCKILSLPEVISYMLITMCAVPSATNTAIFAELYDCDSSLAAQCVGLSTLFSMVTLPAMIQLAGWIL